MKKPAKLAVQIKDQTGMQNVGMGREGQPGQTATESVNLQTNSRLRTAMQSIFLDDFTLRFMGQVHELLRRNMDPQDRLRIIGEEGGPLIASMDPTQVDAKFDLKMEITPTLPFDEQRRQQNAVQMFQLLGMPYLKRLLEAYDGEVPQAMEDLLTLPGVARKTANVVRGVIWSLADGVVVDTHVQRISGLLGWTKAKTAEHIEKDLMVLHDRTGWIGLSHRLIHHGRQICIARRPRCAECPLAKECPSSDA